MRSKLLLLVVAGTCLLLIGADKPDPAASEKAALAAFQDYVGAWRGAGQPRRGSARGAWTEDAAWAWKFADDGPALVMESPEGKYFRSAALRPVGAGKYELQVARGDNRQVAYSGAPDDNGQLILTTDQPVDDLPARVSIRLVAEGKRMVVLLERRTGDRYSRLAEVGYTREGSRFGQGTAYVECVVTGGQGTIPVTHEGKTYYVCCTGCRDYFNESPAEVLAEYRERKEQEAKEREEQK